eukprot:1031671-Prymnesium_polylepis.1
MGPQARSRTWGAQERRFGEGRRRLAQVARGASHLLHGRLVRVGARLGRFQVAYHNPALPARAHCVRNRTANRPPAAPSLLGAGLLPESLT